jgi:ParB family chromosome partitioning protein
MWGMVVYSEGGRGMPKEWSGRVAEWSMEGRMSTMAQHMRGAKPRKLGRGLSSLIGETAVPVSIHKLSDGAGPMQDGFAALPEGETAGPGGLRMIDVGAVVVSPFQPRREIEPSALAGLAASIKRSGVMQPVIVREVGGRFELVAGERRWRGAMAAGLDRVPALVRTLSDEESAEWALVENLQREDLNPIERAAALRSLAERFGVTHSELADRVGLERPTVANLIRLLDLEEQIQGMVTAGLISGGHARALLGVPAGAARMKLAERCARESWSVRRLEGEARALSATVSAAPSSPRAVSGEREALEKQLSEHLGTKVTVRTDRSGKRGTILIDFFDLDQFDGLMSRLGFAMK